MAHRCQTLSHGIEQNPRFLRGPLAFNNEMAVDRRGFVFVIVESKKIDLALLPEDGIFIAARVVQEPIAAAKGPRYPHFERISLLSQPLFNICQQGRVYHRSSLTPKPE